MGGCLGAKKNQPEGPKEEQKPLVPPQREQAKEEAKNKEAEGGNIYRPEYMQDNGAHLRNPQVNQSLLSSRGSRKETLKPKLNLEAIEPDRLRHSDAKDLKASKSPKAVGVSHLKDGDYLVKSKDGVKMENKIQQPFVNNGNMPGFEHPDLKDKCIQPLEIRTTVDNLKFKEQESVYHDQTRGGAELLQKSVAMPEKAELAIDELPELKMAQIKTYLYDRSLASRLTE